MNISGNTVLITGGSAGIGLAIAKLLVENDNQVIVTGRDPERLARVARELPQLTTVVCDVTRKREVDLLVQQLQKDFPRFNMLINNAGRAYAYRLSACAGAFEKAADEILTNYLAVMGITESLLPQLTSKAEAAIVNVSSIVALAPSAKTPTYAASKAALHSYTQSLRITLAPQPNIQVFELMPPLVNTDFSMEIGGSKGIPPEEVAQCLLKALAANQQEIHVGLTANIYKLLQSSPESALMAMNAGN
ncbi:MAG TPA: SDR family NAD(P)-dependent oxidoreductase [Chitinophaga sp.]|uniref:SDR family oxidoreductase n=1 Tax=Chitinophaga sp. TaxID=1869181 RepID=UPI002BD36698|nr:SDR family NAD(P)-dependent oxidoreductase [Chitinophaga sp.]HVI47819.1 SDR family NAD(P)-dependent oxidoreductase [Chitinophaga sp.]